MNPQAETKPIILCWSRSLLESFQLMASEAPATLVSFRVLLSRAFSRLPQIESLLVGYWSQGENKKVIHTAFLAI